MALTQLLLYEYQSLKAILLSQAGYFTTRDPAALRRPQRGRNNSAFSICMVLAVLLFALSTCPPPDCDILIK